MEPSVEEGNEEISLSSMVAMPDKEVTLVDKVISACQEGNLDSLHELLPKVKDQCNNSNEEFSSISDDQGVTPVHWAALNNRISTLEYLIDMGLNPDLKGGDLNATPIMWAARYGFVYVVDLLIKKGNANTDTLDATGVGILHASTFSSNVMMVLYILNTVDGQDIDFQDPSGRSPLHWAAYQGDFLTVEVLIKAGAKLDLQDEEGFTALHWAIVSGSVKSVKSLTKAGSDINITTTDGKTCWTVASDMNFINNWKQILELCQRSSLTGDKLTFLVSEREAKLGTFLIPHFSLPLTIYLLFGNLKWILKVPLQLASFVIQILILKRFFLPVILKQKRTVMKTPLFAGIFSSSALWCLIVEFFILLPYTLKECFMLHLLFLCSFALTYFFFFKAMNTDPGYIPLNESKSKVKETVNELVELMKFDESNFCVHTLIRKPIRCRYSEEKDRNIARFDHYCPWVYNDIGVRNHKLFYGFTLSLFLAICFWTLLAFEYFDELDYDYDDGLCSILGEDICAGYFISPFIFGLFIWVVIQMVWLSILLVVQSFQISKGVTTFEYTKSNERHNHGNSVDTDLDTVPISQDNLEPSYFLKIVTLLLKSKLAKMIGLDQFLLLTDDFLYRKSRQRTILSYNYGFKQNWVDFLFLCKEGDPINFRTLVALPINGEGNLNGQYVDYYTLCSAPEHV